MSTPVRQKLAAHLRTRRDAYVKLAFDEVRPSADPNVPGLTLRDVEQMIDGFIALVVEGLVGESREVRELYLDTVIPGLVAGGHTTTARLAADVAQFGISVSLDAVGALPESDRAEGGRWIAKFFHEYIHDLIVVGEEVSQ